LPKVIFDSSFLMAVAENPTTWFEDIVGYVGKFEPILLDCVRGELEQLASDEGRRGRFARVSLEMTARFATAPCGKTSVDAEIASAAASQPAIVATTDSKLLESLRASHVTVISLRRGRVSPD
jgi:rRNA-processing protein FCF1